MSQVIKGLGNLKEFSLLYKGDNLFDLLHTSPLLKGVCSKRKPFAVMGSQCCPFNVDHFSEERQTNFDRFVSPDIHLKYTFTRDVRNELLISI